MSVKIIAGGSGSGKTGTLRKIIIERAISERDRKFFVIVPEQFTLQTQIDYCLSHPDKGLINIDILSFERLAYRVMAELSENKGEVLRETGKSLLIRRAGETLKGELKVFGKNLRKNGYVSEMKSLFSEFGQYRIDESRLEELLDVSRENETLYRKLEDVRKLKGRFEELLGRDHVTSEQLLEKLSVVIPRSELLRDAVVAFDEFTGFTPIQLPVIGEILRKAGDVYFTLEKESREVREGKTGLFCLGDDMLGDVLRLSAESRSQVDDICLLNRPYPRFTEAEDIAFLEENLFRRKPGVYEKAPENISIHNSRNVREECEFAAGEIARLVREEGVRYKDIAVISGCGATYAPYIQRVFGDYDIPCFIDGRRDVLQNSFVEYIRSAVAIAEERYSYDSVFRFLKCGLSDWEPQDVFALENYVLVMGIKGFARWERSFVRKTKDMSEEELAHLNLLREKLLKETGNLVAALRNSGRTVESVTKAVYEMVAAGELQQRLKDKELAFEEMGEKAIAMEYSQIYKVVMELFDQMVMLLGDDKVTVKEYRELLDAGFSEVRIGIIPPGRDQVIVGDMERTMIKDIGYLFFLGMNDVNLPGKLESGGILTDRERRFLRERDIRLAPTSEEKAFIKRFYLYFCVTKPGRHLYLSYCNADMDGKTLRPAVYLGDIRRLFPELKVTDEIEGEGKRKKPARDKKPQIKRLVSGEMLSGKLADQLYGRDIRTSVSRLETFASCPYKYFARYGLGLSEREEMVYTGLDTGNIIHEALYRYGMRLKQKGLAWDLVTKEQRHKLCESIMDEVTCDYGNSVLTSSAVYARNVVLLKRQLEEAVWAFGEQFSKGDFAAAGYEIKTGDYYNQLPVIEIPLSDGDKLSIIGKVDRVDVAEKDDSTYVRVVDYKTGSPVISLSNMYNGIDLQLMIYLEMASRYYSAKGKKTVPAGVFYNYVQDLELNRSSLKEGTLEEIQESLLEAYRPAGIQNASRGVLLAMDNDFSDNDCTESIASPVKIKKDGSYSSYSNVLTTEEFGLLSARMKKKIAEYGGRIKNGEIEAFPLKDACNYCSYQSVCHFRPGERGKDYRKVPDYKIEDVRKLLHEEEEYHAGMDDGTEKSNRDQG